jgi:hypothetical protein
MDPKGWLEKARQISASYRRNPMADPTAMRVFREQAGQFLGEQNQLNQLHPGRAIGGSGSTGLLPNDASGYAQMLEGQQAQAGLAGFLDTGNPEPNVRYGGTLPSTRSLSEATGRDNSAAFGLPGGFGGAELASMRSLDNATPDYESHDQFMGRYGRKAR